MNHRGMQAAAQAENERIRDLAAHRPGHQARLRVIQRGRDRHANKGRPQLRMLPGGRSGD